MKFEPRAYQTQAVQSVIQAFAQGQRQLLLRLPTGAGKTVIAALILEQMLHRIPGRRMLFLAHRKEIVDQTADKISQQIGAHLVSVEQAERRAAADARVVVASIQSLTARLQDYAAEDFGILIVDECHHAFAKTWMDTISHFGKQGNTLLLGLTATPKRSDGRCISELFPETAFEVSLGELQEQGFLVPMDYFTIEATLGLNTLATDSSGDFQSTQLARMMNTPELRALLLRAWLEKAKGKKTIIFCASIAHAQELTKDFLELGVKAAFISGESTDRDALIQGFRQGAITILSNYGVLTEGFDDPSIACVLLARPTRSPLLYSQCLGRGLRPHPGKQVCTVIDIVDRQQHQLQYNVFEAAGLPRSWQGSGKDPLREAQAIARIRITDPGAFLKIRQALSLDETQRILMDLDPNTVIAGIDGMPMLRYQALCRGHILPQAEALAVTEQLFHKGGIAAQSLQIDPNEIKAILSEGEEGKVNPYLAWHIQRSTGLALKISFQTPPLAPPQPEVPFILSPPPVPVIRETPRTIVMEDLLPSEPAKAPAQLGLKARLEKIIRDGPSVAPPAPSSAPVPVVKELSQGSSIQEKLKAIKADFAQRNRS